LLLGSLRRREGGRDKAEGISSEGDQYHFIRPNLHAARDLLDFVAGGIMIPSLYAVDFGFGVFPLVCVSRDSQ
jgi:hypothetical protein